MKEIKEKWEEILKMMDEIKKYEAIVEEMIYMMTIKMWIIVRKIDEIEKEEIKIQNLNKQKEVKDDEGRVI
jgi:GTPase involved in cell partitioning and DNA repair